MERINETCVSDEHHKSRIDRYLAQRFTYLSRSGWQREIALGRISLNGNTKVRPGQKLSHGDKIAFSGRGLEEPEIDPRFKIIYEDEYILGINKPGNLPVHPAGRYFNNTLVMLLEKQYKSPFYPVHRIDRETSGVILFAKNAETAMLIQKNFDTVKKIYCALVQGTMRNRQYNVNVPLGPDPHSPVRKKRRAHPDAAEQAITRFRRIYRFRTCTMVAAYPETGRLHQIRCHLEYLGYPIIGDKIYGGDERLFLKFIQKGPTEELKKRLLMDRSALHSLGLNFQHPVTGEKLKIRTGIPDDFYNFMGQSYKHG